MAGRRLIAYLTQRKGSANEAASDLLSMCCSDADLPEAGSNTSCRDKQDSKNPLYPVILSPKKARLTLFVRALSAVVRKFDNTFLGRITG